MSISCSAIYTNIEKKETKPHGSVSFPAACYCLNCPDKSIVWHWHSELEFLWVKKGQIRLFAGSRQFFLDEGDGAFINADILHTVSTADGVSHASIHSIVFHPRLIGGRDDSIYWERYLYPLIHNTSYTVQLFSDSISWQKHILRRLQCAWDEIAEDRHGYEFHVRNELSEILLCLSDHQPKKVLALPQKVLRKEQRMKQMLKYIQAHYPEHIFLEDIAKAASISKSECLRCFQEILGTTPLRYVNEYRLVAAAQKLADTDWQICEIGNECGFTEMGYFTAQFKKKYGLTPTKYRALCKRNAL